MKQKEKSMKEKYEISMLSFIKEHPEKAEELMFEVVRFLEAYNKYKLFVEGLNRI